MGPSQRLAGPESTCFRRWEGRYGTQAESFIMTLKVEAVYVGDYETFEDLVADLPTFIEDIYNAIRLNSALGNLSPNTFKKIDAPNGTKVPNNLSIQVELTGRRYELAQAAGGWMFRTKTQFTDAINAAADLGEQSLALTEMEMGVLCAIAYHQPIDRAGLADIFGKEVSRDLLARLRYKDLIASGPRSPRPGAPHTFVTTEAFLVTFDLQSLRDLPELELRDSDA